MRLCITERRSGKPLLFHFNFEPGALGPGARNFHYTTVPAKNQLTKCTNLTPLFIPIFVQHYLLTFGCLCVIIISAGEGRDRSHLDRVALGNKSIESIKPIHIKSSVLVESKSAKKSQEFFKKTLDKWH